MATVYSLWYRILLMRILRSLVSIRHSFNPMNQTTYERLSLFLTPVQICQVKNKTTQFQNTSLLSSHRIKTALHEGSSPRIFDETCSLPVFFSVITMGIAVGILKANLGPFGADQVQSRGQPMVFKYFSWLYWSINLGSLLSFTLLAFVQQNVSFYTGFLIPFIVLVFSFLLFLSGTTTFDI